MRIQFEDDLVVVKDAETGEEIYKGLEDYEELKREDWIWNDTKKLYELTIKLENKIWKLTKERVA